MLVIFGANGRTGREILRHALAAGMNVRPVVRDDRDGRGLDKLIDVSEICYADADHPASLLPVLDGATQVVSCINARTAGHGCPIYGEEAGANIVQAAVEAGIEHVLHLSVVGAYRWSPNPLNRASFRIDRKVRVLKDLPWTMIRVSCYHDEVIEGHVRPPDGGRPHAIARSSRYAPISRRDVGRIVTDLLPKMIPSRTLYIGGPDTWFGKELEALLAPYRRGSGRRTGYGQLPPGDICVMPDTTQIMVDVQPVDRLQDQLDEASPDPTSRQPAPVYPKGDPPAHASDQGKDLKNLRVMGSDLRRTVHAQLVADLVRLGIPTEGVILDFSSARKKKSGRTAKIHGGSFQELTSVRALSPDGELIHRGAIDFLWDKLADEFYCWWAGDGLPQSVWVSLDLGVRRRLASDSHFAGDAVVQSFR
jgi:uncharacterized protein YbjT (DUF2867 family)